MNSKSSPNKQVEEQLDLLLEVPPRNPESVSRGREQYLAAARDLAPGARKTHRSSGRAHRRTWAGRFAVAAAVLLVALSGLGGTVFAAQASQPDDLLYGVKIFSEEVQLSLENDPEEKLDLTLEFANRRLQEIQDQLAAGENVSEQALALLEKHTQRMIDQASRLDDSGLNQALRQIETNLQNQNQLHAQLGQEGNQGDAPGLLKAQEKIRQRLELVTNGLQDPQGYRNTVREQQENSDNPGQNQKNNPDNPGKKDNPPGQEKNNGQGKGVGKGKDGDESQGTQGEGSPGNGPQ